MARVTGRASRNAAVPAAGQYQHDGLRPVGDRAERVKRQRGQPAEARQVTFVALPVPQRHPRHGLPPGRSEAHRCPPADGPAAVVQARDHIMLPASPRRSHENPDPDEGEVTREGAGSHSRRHRADLCGVGGPRGRRRRWPPSLRGERVCKRRANRESVVQAGDAQQLHDLGAGSGQADDDTARCGAALRADQHGQPRDIAE